MKRIFLISGGVIAALAIIVLGFFLRSRGTQSSPVATSQTASVGLPAAGGSTGNNSSSTNTSAATSLSQFSGPILAYFVRPDKSVVSVGVDGKIVLTTSASSTLLSTQPLTGIVQARFSPDGKKILITSSAGDSSSPYWSVYDMDKNSWRQLSLDARDAVFAPQGETIAYWNRKISGVTLTTLDLSRDSSKPVGVLALSAEDAVLTWGAPNTIFFGDRPSSGLPGNLWSIDLKTRTVRSVVKNAAGAELLWGTTDGLLFTARPSGGGTLTLVGQDFSPEQTLIFLTLPSKCAFYGNASSSLTILCGVPRNALSFRRASLPEDYYTGALMTSDDLLSIDLKSGVVTPLTGDASANIDVQDPTVVGTTAYFVNRWDQRLYKQDLP